MTRQFPEAALEFAVEMAKFIAAVVGALVVLLMLFSVLTMPRHGGKSKSYFATMKADLRNLVTSQEAYFTDSARYAPSLEVLGDSLYMASSGVTVTLTTVSDNYWAATARHVGLPEDATCSIEVGFPDSLSTQPDGEPVCPQQQPKTRSWVFIWER